MHLMSAEEVRSLFGDIVEGLAFLVSVSMSPLFLPSNDVRPLAR